VCSNDVKSLSNGKVFANCKRDQGAVIASEVVLATRLDFVAPMKKKKKKKKKKMEKTI
jgi:hypothetical protein